MTIFSPYSNLCEQESKTIAGYLKAGDWRGLRDKLKTLLEPIKGQVLAAKSDNYSWLKIRIWRFEIASINYYDDGRTEVNIMGNIFGDMTPSEFASKAIQSQKRG